VLEHDHHAAAHSDKVPRPAAGAAKQLHTNSDPTAAIADIIAQRKLNLVAPTMKPSKHYHVGLSSN